MLQSMRHLAQSWVFKGLMLILIISFGIWGIGDIFRGNPLHRTVAKTGRVAITVQDLNREFEQTLQRARGMFGPELTGAQAKQMGLLDTALNTLIERAQVDQDVKQLGISVNDRTVLERLAVMPQFRNPDGSLNADALRTALVRANVSERDFLSEERREMARHQLIDIFTEPKQVPALIADLVYKGRAQKRILDVVTLKNDSMGDVAPPDDKALHDYYDQNPALFTAPEHRAITIAQLSTDAIAKGVTVSDADLHKEYDSKSAGLAHPEQRDIIQVVLQDEAKAKKLAAVARASGKLAVEAKKEGYDPVPLNDTEEKTILPQLAKPVFTMKTNEVSEPIKSDLGWHVVQLYKIVPAGTPSFDDMKDSLRGDMQRDRAIDEATREANKLDDELAAGHALEDIADGMRLRLVKIPAVLENGKTPDGKDPPEFPYKDDVLKAAYAQNAGETSPVMDDKQGNYYVVRTDEVKPSAVQPYDEVKNDVLKAWKLQAQAKAAADKADKIEQALREGKPAASFAADKGVEVRMSKPLSLLGDTDPALPEPLVARAMQMKKGDVAKSPASGEQVIVRLADIVDTGADVDQAARDKVNEELANDMAKEQAEEYMKYLNVLFPPEIHHDVMETVSEQGS